LGSWFDNPVSDFAYEARRNRFASSVISHGDHDCAGVERSNSRVAKILISAQQAVLTDIEILP